LAEIARHGDAEVGLEFHAAVLDISKGGGIQSDSAPLWRELVAKPELAIDQAGFARVYPVRQAEGAEDNGQ
jgi:hypothetical protein